MTIAYTPTITLQTKTFAQVTIFLTSKFIFILRFFHIVQFGFLLILNKKGDVVSNAIYSDVRLQRVTFGESGISTMDVECKSLRSIVKWDKYIYTGLNGEFGSSFMGKSRIIRNRRRVVDLRYWSVDRCEDIRYSENGLEDPFESEARALWPNELQLSPSALSVNSSRRVPPMGPKFIRRTPLRFLKGSKKLLERVRRIAGVTVIGSLHLVTPPIKGSIPIYETESPLPIVKADDADSDEEGESEAYVMEQIRIRKERRAEFLESMGRGFRLQLRLYVPTEAHFHFCKQTIPAQSTYLVEYGYQDLVIAVPDQDEQTVLLNSLYEVFFYEATEEQTTAAERTWISAFDNFLDRFSWAYDIIPEAVCFNMFNEHDKVEVKSFTEGGEETWKPGKVLRPLYSELAQGQWSDEPNNAYSVDDDTCEDNGAFVSMESVFEKGQQQSSVSTNSMIYDVIFDDGTTQEGVMHNMVRPHRSYETFEEKLQTANRLMNSYVRNSVPSCRIALARSNVVYRKSAFRFENDALRPDEQGRSLMDEGYIQTSRIPIMHCYIWISGFEIGVVFYDIELQQVHLLQKSPEEQKGTVEMLLTMSKHDMLQTLTMMMEAELEYTEIFDENTNEYVGTVQFVTEDNSEDAAADDNCDEGTDRELDQNTETKAFTVEGAFDDLEIDFSDEEQ